MAWPPDVQSVSRAVRNADVDKRGSVSLGGVIDDVLTPEIDRLGLDCVLKYLLEAKEDPYIAAALVEMCGVFSHEDGRVLRATEIFKDEEIVGAGVAFLATFPSGGLAEGRWAWNILWNAGGEVSPTDHARLVQRLVELAPWEDQVLWLIGEGPLSRATVDAAPEMSAWEQTLDDNLSSKVARIRYLVAVDWPHNMP